MLHFALSLSPSQFNLRLPRKQLSSSLGKVSQFIDSVIAERRTQQYDPRNLWKRKLQCNKRILYCILVLIAESFTTRKRNFASYLTFLEFSHSLNGSFCIRLSNRMQNSAILSSLLLQAFRRNIKTKLKLLLFRRGFEVVWKSSLH